MAVALAFDIYGTLADVSGVGRALARKLGDDKQAAAVSNRWREKQLEYAFRRSLMALPADFAQCTRHALAFALAENNAALGDNDQAALAAEYATLPFFPDARPALSALARRGDAKLFAFSNGAPAAVRKLLEANDAAHFFADIVSVAEVGKFKPAPEVYARFLRRAGAKADNAWLVSANPFDILGAQNAGMRAAWIRRGAAQFDPWDDFPPPTTLRSLKELEAAVF